MSRKTTTLKALVVVGAVAGTTLLAGTASAATATITKVAPTKTATTTAATIAIAGRDFDSTIQSVVFQTTSQYTCVSTSVVIVSPSLLYAVKPAHASNCVAGAQKVELHSASAPTDDSTIIGSEFAPAAAANTVTFVAPVAASAVSVANGLTSGGTALTVTHGSVSYTSATVHAKISATIGGVSLPVRRTSATTFTTVTPANRPGALDLILTSNGVAGPAYNGFTYKQGVKVTPASAPKGTPGEIVVTGVGFKPSSTSKVWVSFCGFHVAPLNTGAKLVTDKKLFVTVPAASVVEGFFTTPADATVTAADGGSCPVKVVVDPSGDGVVTTGALSDTAADDVKSVVTKDNTFTYAAF